jgi:ABC-2 type transport system ATP-binding protein
MEMAFRETVCEAKERGQTVFLSSHILSEVEAVCDRVGILRQGRLVDQGRLAEPRHLSAQTVEVDAEASSGSRGPLEPVDPGESGNIGEQLRCGGGCGPGVVAVELRAWPHRRQ